MIDKAILFFNASHESTPFKRKRQLWIYEVSNVSPIPNKHGDFPLRIQACLFWKKITLIESSLGLRFLWIHCQVVLQATPRLRCKGHSWTWCPQVWCGYRTYHVVRIPSYIWLMLLVNVGKLYHIVYIDAMDSTEYIYNFQMQVSHSTCSYLWSLWNYPSNNYVSRNYRSPFKYGSIPLKEKVRIACTPQNIWMTM